MPFNLENFLAAAGFYPLSPAIETLPLSNQTPLELYKSASSDPFLIEVNEGRHYSYVGFDPILTIKVFKEEISLTVSSHQQTLKENPLKLIRDIFNALKSCRLPGFMAYEAAALFENLPPPKGVQEIPDIYLILHNTSYHFDYTQQKIIRHHYNKTPIQSSKPHFFESKKCCNVTAVQEFEAKVKMSQKHIVAGDAFQIVLSRTFEQKAEVSPLELYEAIKANAPTPFMYLYEGNDFGVAGASPERLVKLENGIVETMPIAGTRGIGSGISPEAMAEELLNDPKEIAEHMMLVDLGRNDLGIVSKPGTVEVTELMRIRQFPHIMHLISKIQGQLHTPNDALDVLKAVFPAGTLTGAPKIRAMEIINALEEERRGLYGGAVLYLEGLDQCDSFIAIRTAFFKNRRVKVRTGAGIVLDSVPSNEANETLHKAKGILHALKIAQESKNVSHLR